MKSLLAVFLVLLLPLPAVAQPCPFALLREPNNLPQEAAEANGLPETASASVQAAPEVKPPASVDPKLLNKKVVVHLPDGRVYKGKLVELTDDFLLLKMHKRTEKIVLTDVATVERQPRNWKKAFIILAVVVGIGFVIGAIIGTREPD